MYVDETQGSIRMPIFFLSSFLFFFLSCKCLHPRSDRTKREHTHTQSLQQCWCHFILSSLVFFFFSHFFLYSLLQWIETYIYVHTQLTWLSTHMYIILYIYNMIYKWFIHSHSIWFFSFRKENITIDERCKRKTKEMIWQTADANVVDSSITSSWKREERMPVYIYQWR
jgi:hypothetical protein